MTAPISLAAFADLARRRGNTAYVPPSAHLPSMKAVRHSLEAPRHPKVLPATFPKLRNTSASTNHSPVPLDLTGCAALDASAHEPRSKTVRSTEPHPPMPYKRPASVLAAASTVPRDPKRTVCVPDQHELARRCSAEIELLTYRCAIGRLADPKQARFAMCAGRKQKQWKTRLIRLPIITDTDYLVTSFKEKWQLVTEFHWGVSSAEIARRLVRSVGGAPEDIAEPDPDIDEWDVGGEGGTRFVTGLPWERRVALEREKIPSIGLSTKNLDRVCPARRP